MSSIAACFNVYNDAAALRGALENAQSFFDNIFVIVTPPGGEKNKDDATCDLLREFGIEPRYGDINEGFGVIRTRLIHECGCDWAFLLDSDERFYPSQPVLLCEGSERFPQHEFPKLKITRRPDLIYQGQHIRELIKDSRYDAIKTIRRHWQDFSMKRPSENWEIHKDWQLRVVRNVQHISYRSDVRMHERIWDTRTNGEPRHFTADVHGGPFHDHFHVFFRRARPGHKEENERRYDRLAKGEAMIQ